MLLVGIDGDGRGYLRIRGNPGRLSPVTDFQPWGYHSYGKYSRLNHEKNWGYRRPESMREVANAIGQKNSHFGAARGQVNPDELSASLDFLEVV